MMTKNRNFMRNILEKKQKFKSVSDIIKRGLEPININVKKIYMG